MKACECLEQKQTKKKKEFGKKNNKIAYIGDNARRERKKKWHKLIKLADQINQAVRGGVRGLQLQTYVFALNQ